MTALARTCANAALISELLLCAPPAVGGPADGPAGLPSQTLEARWIAEPGDDSACPGQHGPRHPAFEEDFRAASIAGNPGERRRWSAMFTRWNTRYIAGNGDKGVKMADSTLLPSGRTAGEALRRSGRWGNGPQYLADVSNGTLKLRAYPLTTAMRQEFWGFPYVASMIAADQEPGLRYGCWELKARINAVGKGQHLAFWLLPDDGSWPPEVDILEVVGKNPHQFTANSHASSESRPMTFYAEPRSPDGFHTFRFGWTPSKMTWEIDGRVVREEPACIGDKPMHFLASWEIGSHWPGEPDSSSPWPAEVEIAYVRVFRWRG